MSGGGSYLHTCTLLLLYTAPSQEYDNLLLLSPLTGTPTLRIPFVSLFLSTLRGTLHQRHSRRSHCTLPIHISGNYFEHPRCSLMSSRLSSAYGYPHFFARFDRESSYLARLLARTRPSPLRPPHTWHQSSDRVQARCAGSAAHSSVLVRLFEAWRALDSSRPCLSNRSSFYTLKGLTLLHPPQSLPPLTANSS